MVEMHHEVYFCIVCPSAAVYCIYAILDARMGAGGRVWYTDRDRGINR